MPRSKIEISAERAIAEMQILHLLNIAKGRPLNYEEAKIYDLTVKNLLLLKQDEKEDAKDVTNEDNDEISSEELEKVIHSSKAPPQQTFMEILEDAKEPINE